MSAFDRFPLESPLYDYREQEPFFTHALPCGSCGKPCDSLIPAPWDVNVRVGPCCVEDLSETIPDHPVCSRMQAVYDAATSVETIQAAWKHHGETCLECIRYARDAQRSVTRHSRERAA